jgi:hypothetical protein
MWAISPRHPSIRLTENEEGFRALQGVKIFPGGKDFNCSEINSKAFL